MRNELQDIVALIDKNATIAKFKRGYKVLFDTPIVNTIIDTFNELCKKYNYRWVLSVICNKFCIMFIEN